MPGLLALTVAICLRIGFGCPVRGTTIEEHSNIINLEEI
jgi:hypothetical protein